MIAQTRVFDENTIMTAQHYRTNSLNNEKHPHTKTDSTTTKVRVLALRTKTSARLNPETPHQKQLLISIGHNKETAVIRTYVYIVVAQTGTQRPVKQNRPKLINRNKTASKAYTWVYIPQVHIPYMHTHSCPY